MRWTGLLSKITVFFLVTIVLTGSLVMMFGGFRAQPTTTYHAVFDDISGLTPASEVRAAGMNVGQVEGTERRPDNRILVTFTVQDGIPLKTGTSAVIRYKNLVGDRVLQLANGPGSTMPEGGTIPVSRTRPALDLDALYNGFTPLFQGLRPDQINRLSSSLIEVLQGQGSAVEGLLGDLGSLTTTLADRSAVVNDVVDQLNTVLETLIQRAPELNDTIVNLQRVVSGLAEDRQRIGGSLEGINDLTASVSGLLHEQRPDIKGTVSQLYRFAATLEQDHAALDNLLRRLPGYYVPLGRLGATQAAFQFYVCGLRLRINTPAGPINTPYINSGDLPRC